jgi:hypothetical protein
MDTKLKADIAEFAVITELLRQGFRVLKPVGDRLPYDLAVDIKGCLVRMQVKSAWFSAKKNMYLIDARRTCTNRKKMLRKRYTSEDFDCAIIFIADRKVFYVMPVDVFNSYSSSISLVEGPRRQRPPKSASYRERWDLIACDIKIGVRRERG